MISPYSCNQWSKNHGMDELDNVTVVQINCRVIIAQPLSDRSLPPTVLGDIIVVQAGDRVSAGKIINSLLEIHLGDLVVKR